LLRTTASCDLGSERIKMKRIKKNNLLPWFTQDHSTLPANYLHSCEEFFKSLKLPASGCKLQASSLTAQGPGDSSRIIKENKK